MEILSGQGTEGDKKCIKVENETWCYDPAPKDTDKCIKVDGYFLCKTDMKEKTFREEVNKFKEILFYPRLRIDEAKSMELLIIEFTIGFILSALVFTLSFYIKDIIDFIVFYVFPLDYGLFSIVIIVIIMIVITMALALLQFRFQKATKETSILEKLAEKSPVEALNTLLGE